MATKAKEKAAARNGYKPRLKQRFEEEARERLKERLGFRRWLRRQSKIALERLRMVFEEASDAPLARATVAGWEPARGPRFGRSTRGARG